MRSESRTREASMNFINFSVPIMFPMMFPCSLCVHQDVPMFTMGSPRCSQCVAQGCSLKHQGKVSVAKHASMSRSDPCSKHIGGGLIKWLLLGKKNSGPSIPSLINRSMNKPVLCGYIVFYIS